MDYAYSYPPSKNLLRYGELEEESNFNGKGILFLENGEKIRCNFEVGYTQSGVVIVVCYFTYDNIKKSLGVPTGKSTDVGMSRSILSQRPVNLIGRDFRDELMICIESLQCRTIYNRSIAFSPNKNVTVALYSAECFQAYISDKDFQRDFDSKSHKISDPYYNISGLDFPDWFTHRNKKERHEVNYFDFTFNADFKIKLYHTVKPDQRLYDNQATGKLYVYGNDSSEWDTDKIVDYWCAMLSLAIGRNVSWTSRSTEISKWLVDYLNKQWESQHLHGVQGFQPLLIRRNNLDKRVGWDLISEFVKASFHAVLSDRISIEDSSVLVRIIRKYVDYRLFITPEEGEMRLLTTLAEEFLFTWEKTKSVTPPNIVTKSESKKLQEILADFLSENKENFLTESLENYFSIKEKIMGEIRKNVRRKTFRERLQFFFDHFNFSLMSEEVMIDRIKAFVATRDAINHRGTFQTFKDKNIIKSDAPTLDREIILSVTDELNNVRTMIPLMIMAMIGYKGEFEDLLGKTWQ